MEKASGPSYAEFSPMLRVFGQRIKVLQRRTALHPNEEAQFFTEVLAELQASLEELRRQNDELAAAQRTIEHERQRYRDLFEFAPDAYVVTDTAGMIREVNRAAADLFGIAQHAVVGKPLVLYLAPASRSAFYALLRRGPQGEGMQTWEAVVQPRNRGPVPVSVRMARIQDFDETSHTLRWVLRDITEQIEARDAADRHAAVLEQIVESSEDAIIRKSLGGIVTGWNAAAERLFGYRAEEMIGHSILCLLPPERHDEERRTWGRLRRGERVEPFETVYRTKGGRLVDVSVTTSPLRDARGRVSGASQITRDIGERKRAQEALAQKARALAHARADLRQVAYVLAHDLQEPARQVGLYTQRIAKRCRDDVDPDSREAVAFVVEGSRRMQEQLCDLLRYLELDEPGPRKEQTNCDLLVRRVLDELRDAIAATGAAVTHGPLPTLTAHPRQLRLVFRELIDNALKFRTTAPPRVHVSAEREGQAWRFAVRDNGLGIEAQAAGQLFGFFRKLQRRTDYPGTGMGLALCRKVIDRHGGRIWVESVPGTGATVFFTVPDHASALPPE
jgi:PAS domain S-box-containing protein